MLSNGLILHCLLFSCVPTTVFGSTAIYIGGFVAEGTFQDLTLDVINHMTYVNNSVKVQQVQPFAGCEIKGHTIECNCSEPGSFWSKQECQDYRCCIPEVESTIFEGDLMIENLKHSLPDLVNIYVYYLMKPVGIITNTLLVASCQVSDIERCGCESEHVWSNTVCESHPYCCNQPKCVANISHYTPLCLPKTIVELAGKIKSDYEIKPSEDAELGEMIQKAFQKLSGFNSSVVKVSPDKLRADFNVTLNAVFKTRQLQDLINELETNLSARIDIESKGVAEISILDNSPYLLKCSMEEELLTECRLSWSVVKDGKQLHITNGTQTTIKCQSKSNTTLELQEGALAGLYICSLRNGSISHKDSVDIPQGLHITMASDPQTADCNNHKTSSINTSCTISPHLNDYNITLELYGHSGERKKVTSLIDIPCNDTLDLLNVTCTVTHQYDDKSYHKILEVPVIKSGEKICPFDDPWPKTKVGYKVTLSNCSAGRTGNKSRTCNGENDWGSVFNYCVKEEVKNLLLLAKDLAAGYGNTVEGVSDIFSQLNNISDPEKDTTLGDVEAFINILHSMMTATSNINIRNNSVMDNFVDSANNILSMTCNGDNEESKQNLYMKYLESVVGLVQNIQVNQSKGRNTTLIQFQVRQEDMDSPKTISDVKLTLSTSAWLAKVLAIKNLTEKLYNNIAETVSSSIMIIVALEGHLSKPEDVILDFPLNRPRPQNHEIYCVQRQTSTNRWVEEGCKWISKGRDRAECRCNDKTDTGRTSRVTSFSTLMAKHPVDLPYLQKISLAGLGISICSLVILILVECLVWNSVTNTNIAFFRHTVLLNIAIFLLLANSCFLQSFIIEKLHEPWCLILTVAKHFFYLGMFFWMFCLSMLLLHQIIFVFSPVGKKTFFLLSLTTGYICPMVTVAVTYLYYTLTSSPYHDPKSCWLQYLEPMKGSIHAFLIPVGAIILVNLFTIVKVIVTHLRPQISVGMVDEKKIARSIIKVIAVMTPVFGVTWGLGFFVFVSDVTEGILPKLVNYAFTVTNSLQGFFLLLTGLLGERQVLHEISKRFSCSTPERSESKRDLTSSIQKSN